MKQRSYLVTVDLHFASGNIVRGETFQTYALDRIRAEQKIREQMPPTVKVHITQVTDE